MAGLVIVVGRRREELRHRHDRWDGQRPGVGRLAGTAGRVRRDGRRHPRPARGPAPARGRRRGRSARASRRPVPCCTGVCSTRAPRRARARSPRGPPRAALRLLTPRRVGSAHDHRGPEVRRHVRRRQQAHPRGGRPRPRNPVAPATTSSSVVSAMGDTTDELLAMAHGITPAPNPRELDLLLTAGERIAMSLLAIAINDAGCRPRRTRDRRRESSPTPSTGRRRSSTSGPVGSRRRSDAGNVVIVAGFQGVSERRPGRDHARPGRIRHDRGGAGRPRWEPEFCEIYTDVDGVYTADPRVVTGARQAASRSRTRRCSSWRRAAPRSSSYDRSSTRGGTASGCTSGPRSPTSPARGSSRRTYGWSRR